MKNILLLSVLLMISPLVLAGEQTTYPGEYECMGKELGGDDIYKMRLWIDKTGETYAVNSESLTDKYKSTGVGLYNTSNRSLSVSFMNPENTKESGIAIFTQKSPKTMDVLWTYIGEKKTEKAICQKKEKKV